MRMAYEREAHFGTKCRRHDSLSQLGIIYNYNLVFNQMELVLFLDMFMVAKRNIELPKSQITC